MEDHVETPITTTPTTEGNLDLTSLVTIAATLKNNNSQNRNNINTQQTEKIKNDNITTKKIIIKISKTIIK